MGTLLRGGNERSRSLRISRDLDILGDRTTLEEIAQLVGVPPRYYPLKPPTNGIGYIAPKPDTNNTPLLIEVLRRVHGISTEKLQTNTVEFKIGEQNTPVRVPSPIHLLQAKLANICELNQNNRQDRKHVRILCQAIPCYLKDFEEFVIQGLNTEKELLHMLQSLLEVLTYPRNRQALDTLAIIPLELFRPLKSSKLSKISAFYAHALPRKLVH